MPSESEGRAQSFWFDLAAFSAFSTAVGYIFYLWGWFYLYGYFAAFGLSLTEQDLDWREVIIFGVRSALGWRGYLFLGGIILGVVLGARWLEKTARGRAKERAWWFKLGVGTGGLAIILAGSVFAQVRGDSNAFYIQRDPGCQLPSARIFAEGSKLPREVGEPAETAGGSREVNGHLLIHGKKGYFVFAPLPVEELKTWRDKGLRTVQMPVYFVPDAAVLAAIVQPCVDVK